MKHFTILILLLFFVFSLLAQKHDNIWTMGFNGQNPHPDVGGMILDFNDNILEISEHDFPISLRATNASISDSLGDLLFYTNGIHIINFNHQIMENGDSLSPYGNNFSFYDFGQNIPQSILIIPIPEKFSSYAVFHEYSDSDPNPPGLVIFNPILLYSEVDMTMNNGLGTVVIKNQVLLEDTLAYGKLTTVKHANGRDWWVFVPEYDRFYTHKIYRFLLSPEGFFNTGKMDAGPGLSYNAPSVGNTLFSPDGTKYVRQDIRFNPWNAIDIYDFDRCSGELVHLEHIEINDTSFLTGGAAISSDSRYLYAVTNNTIYQYDLLASGIEASEKIVAEYDGYVGYVYESRFGPPLLAPDGKIYIAAYATDNVMHLINSPNHPGLASRVEQHAIILPNLNDKSIPNFPNFRLGPLDGSPCDTPGLDNHPLSGFTWYAEELAVTFSDNSHYRPEEWEWDFGDGNSSEERNPIHTFDAPSEYLVCLTVSNEYDSDTNCRWVQVDTMAIITGTEERRPGTFSLVPNPAKQQVTIFLTGNPNTQREIVFFDSFGREVLRWEVQAGAESLTLDISSLKDGMYFCRLLEDNKQVNVQKLVVVK